MKPYILQVGHFRLLKELHFVIVFVKTEFYLNNTQIKNSVCLVEY